MSDLGEITPCWTITFRRRSKHPPARVWAALTDPDQVSRWWHGPARIDLRVGGEYHVDFSQGGSLEGVIVRVQPERLLACVWGVSVLEWTIEADGEGCRYTFTSHGQPPALEGASYTDEGIAAGWHQGLDTIDSLLDGDPSPPKPTREAWERLKDLYLPSIDAVLSKGGI
jgi:uncharacterized protein YndB with AHSA1/START domain